MTMCAVTFDYSLSRIGEAVAVVAMSGAVRRRERALARERANIMRYAGKKSSMELMHADHGHEARVEEQSRGGGLSVTRRKEKSQTCKCSWRP